MKCLAIFTASLLATAPALAAPYVPVMLTPEAAKADIALMRRGIETVHPGLYRYRSKAEIDAAFARLEAVANSAVSELALHKAIALMLAEIHCDHTKPELSDALNEYRRANPTHLPLRFVIVEGRMIVSSTDGQVGSPPRGAEILRINAMPVPSLLTALGRAVSYDGTTDQAIPVKLASDADLSGDDFDEFYPSFFGFPANWNIIWKQPGETAETEIDLHPVTFPRWTELKPPFGAQREEFYKSIGFRLSRKTALLRIDTFVNYRNPVDTDAFLGGFFKSMKANGTEQLILDLRHNGGGSEDVSISLGRYLFDKPFVWGKPARLKAIRYGDLPDHIESWGDRQSLFNPPESAFTRDGPWWDRTPAPDDEANLLNTPLRADRFAGKLTILTGPINGSGATRTVAQFRENRGATLVGEDTSGSAEGPTAGHIFLLTLPNSKLKVRIPNAWNRTNIKQWAPGRGVTVDTLVTATLADFEAGRDRVLERAARPHDPPAPSKWAGVLASIFTGNWRGTLDYRDYGNDGRTALPTMLTAQAEKSGLALSWTYDDGPGKTVRSATRWVVDPLRRTLTIGTGQNREVQSITEFDVSGGADDFTMISEGTGTENNAKVLIRTIVTRRGNRLGISRQSRKPGEPFLMRDAYLLEPIS
jgi:hypothetical protein